MDKRQKMWKLFISTFYISAFTFGGGFVIVSFMKKKFVDELHWIGEEEMLDMIALAQSCPGPIAVNAAIQVGWHVGGFWGMLIAVLGTALPPLIILGIISLFYAAFATNRYIALLLKGMQAGVAAVITDVVLNLGSGILKKKKFIYDALMIAAFAAVMFTKVNVVFIILAAALVGIALELINRKRGISK